MHAYALIPRKRYSTGAVDTSGRDLEAIPVQQKA
jgi:hypothetical protein